MKENNKVIRGISLTPELWVSIDTVKSPQISRSAFIGMAVEEYVQNHYSNKLAGYMAV